MRGFGIWVFAAVYGTAYQILMSPLIAADSLGKVAGDKVAAQMELEAARSERTSSDNPEPRPQPPPEAMGAQTSIAGDSL